MGGRIGKPEDRKMGRTPSNQTRNKYLPLNNGAIRNDDMKPLLENCPINDCITKSGTTNRNKQIMYGKTPAPKIK